ncbi:MAG: hypothetical protein ACRCUM_00025 [Mycoplasmoidaceae bacterium]
MNKKLKFSLLGTIITSSALAITLPIVSCSESINDYIKITSVNYSEAREALRVEITREMRGLSNFDEQTALAEQWKNDVILPNNLKSAIIDNIYFEDNEGNVYENNSIIDNIVFTDIKLFLRPNTNQRFVERLTIQINFKKGYSSLKQDSFFLFIDIGIGS